MFPIVAGAALSMAAESFLLNTEEERISKAEYEEAFQKTLHDSKKPLSEEKLQEQLDLLFTKQEEDLGIPIAPTKAPAMQRLRDRVMPVMDYLEATNEQYINRPVYGAMQRAADAFMAFVSPTPEEAKVEELLSNVPRMDPEVYNMFVRKKPEYLKRKPDDTTYNMMVKKKKISPFDAPLQNATNSTTNDTANSTNSATNDTTNTNASAPNPKAPTVKPSVPTPITKPLAPSPPTKPVAPTPPTKSSAPIKPTEPLPLQVVAAAEEVAEEVAHEAGELVGAGAISGLLGTGIVLGAARLGGNLLSDSFESTKHVLNTLTKKDLSMSTVPRSEPSTYRAASRISIDKGRQANGDDAPHKLKNVEQVARQFLLTFANDADRALTKLASDYSIRDIETILHAAGRGILNAANSQTVAPPAPVRDFFNKEDVGFFVSENYRVNTGASNYPKRWSNVSKISVVENALVPRSAQEAEDRQVSSMELPQSVKDAEHETRPQDALRESLREGKKPLSEIAKDYREAKSLEVMGATIPKDLEAGVHVALENTGLKEAIQPKAGMVEGKRINPITNRVEGNGEFQKPISQTLQRQMAIEDIENKRYNSAPPSMAPTKISSTRPPTAFTDFAGMHPGSDALDAQQKDLAEGRDISSNLPPPTTAKRQRIQQIQGQEDKRLKALPEDVAELEKRLTVVLNSKPITNAEKIQRHNDLSKVLSAYEGVAKSRKAETSQVLLDRAHAAIAETRGKAPLLDDTNSMPKNTFTSKIADMFGGTPIADISSAMQDMPSTLPDVNPKSYLALEHSETLPLMDKYKNRPGTDGSMPMYLAQAVKSAHSKGPMATISGEVHSMNQDFDKQTFDIYHTPEGKHVLSDTPVAGAIKGQITGEELERSYENPNKLPTGQTEVTRTVVQSEYPPVEPGHPIQTAPVLPQEPESLAVNFNLTPTIPTSGLAGAIGSQIFVDGAGVAGAGLASSLFGPYAGHVFAAAYAGLVKDIALQNTPYRSEAGKVLNQVRGSTIEGQHLWNTLAHRGQKRGIDAIFLEGKTETEPERIIRQRSELNELGFEPSIISPLTTLSSFSPVGPLVSEAFLPRKGTDLVKQTQDEYREFYRQNAPYAVHAGSGNLPGF